MTVTERRCVYQYTPGNPLQQMWNRTFVVRYIHVLNDVEEHAKKQAISSMWCSIEYGELY